MSEIHPTLQETTSLNPSLLKLKLLDCIRSGDTARLDKLMTDVSAAESTNENLAKLHRELLHYAVQVGPISIIKHIVDAHLVDDINYPDSDGNMPLHLAAISARNDVIEYLMSLPTINDCVLDKELKQPIECTSNMEIVQLLSDLRTRYVEVEAAKLRRGFQSHDFDLLDTVLSSPRARELLDINGTDPITGDTVLMEFIRKDDAEMVKFILKHGGDPFKRSVNGRLPIDCAISPAMRKVIRDACNDQTVIDSFGAEHPPLGPPTFKGFLKKWTNFAGGYKLRWFVLAANGTLSYYRSPTEMNNACRGMIHLAHAQVKMDSSERCKFELLIANQSGGSPIKWHLKANHQIESNRWVWTLQNAIRYARDEQKKTGRNGKKNQSGQQQLQQQQQQQQQQQVQAHRRQPSNQHQQLTAVQQARQPSAAPSSPVSRLSSAESHIRPRSQDLRRSSSEGVNTLASSPISRSTASLALGEAPNHHARSSSRSSVTSSSSHKSVVSSVARGAKKLYKKPIKRLGRLSGWRSQDRLAISAQPTSPEAFYDQGSDDSGLEGEYEEESSTEADVNDDVDAAFEDVVFRKRIPDSEDLTIVRNQIRIELNSFREFLRNAESDTTVTREELVSVASGILDNLSNLYEKEGYIVKQKESRLEKMFDRQHEISTIWETSIRQLELEIQDREKKICDLEDTIKLVRRSLRASVIIPAEEAKEAVSAVGGPSLEIPPSKAERGSVSSVPDPQLAKFLEQENESSDEFFDAEEAEEENLEAKNAEAEILREEEVKTTPREALKKEAIQEVEEEEEEEEEEEGKGEGEGEEVASREATLVEEGNKKYQPSGQLIPFKPEVIDGKYVVDGYTIESDAQKALYTKILDEGTFKGYEDPIRSTLAKDDDRPKISLWAVLKSLVGKDMTRMTLPVTFNEPTSLLQRNIEILEYASLLDKAATQKESTLRLVNVAGFAASEYVSTVGRIAKPFNPLLGETFEYARPDKGYRVFCEQVSHHPPISAIVAESPYWSYYGESNVKTKFYGRSFDIKHLGTWFCELYPSDGTIDRKDGKKKSMELYSWNKVNNSVVGIIIGHPTIDNYGEMEIRNHMTGDYMNFHFKPRGWRASSAYEVKGEVFSADGTLQYQIGGHWNTKIYAKSAIDPSAPKFVVFSASKRHEMMFHLTDFAASLNAPQPHLLPVVACTDTRLRPDQRAMENGEYDLASEEKNRVEEKQRAARKDMEEKGVTYKPTFFVKGKHPITGDEYWRFTGSYWKDRRDGKLKHYRDIY